MSTDWVEVSERNGKEFRIRLGIVLKYLFDHSFSLSIGIGGNAAILFHALVLAVSVHASTARKHYLVALMLLHHPEEVDGPRDVVVVVFQRLGN